MIESFTGSTLSISQQNADISKTTGSEEYNSNFIGCCKIIRFISDNRQKVFYTICMYASFIVMGGIVGHIGPTLLDVQTINRVDLEEGSWLITSLYIGYSLGTLLGGFLFTRCKVPWIFIGSLLLLIPCVSAIPWSRLFSLTIILYFISGLVIGVLDVVGNTEMIQQWKDDAKYFLFILHLNYFVGGMISPLYTGPFLKNDEHFSTTDLSLNNSYLNMFSNDSTPVFRNNTLVFPEELLSPSFVLYIPFTITSVFIFIVLVMFLVYVSCISKRKHDPDDNSKQLTSKHAKIMFPKTLKILGVFSLWVVVALSNAMTASFASFLSIFCVEYLSWSKLDSSNIMSVHFASVVIGDIAGIPFSKYFKNPSHIGIQCSLMCLSFIIVFIAAEARSNVCMWVGASLFGYGRSVVCSLVFTWVNETFVTLSSKLASMFLLGGMIFSVLNSLLIAFLMEKLSKMWFCYIFLIEVFIMLFFYAIPTILAYYGRIKYSTKTQSNLIEKSQM